ncbi:MAG: ubiquitin-like protein Pup [Actinomycetota bacterium]|nr:ubiquitin-like protein Pup [Actinomycetota bacterium]
MPQRESAEQRRSSREDVVDEEVVHSAESAPAELDAEVDSILDEIDSVLEENAEDFVKSFVQKGGQ